MTREIDVQNAVRLELGDARRYPDVVLWRNNCGVMVNEHGQRIRFGVANPGGADLLGIFTAPTGGIFIAAEIKADTGKQTDEQKRFEQLVTAKGGEYAVLRSADDARAWIERLRKKHAGTDRT